MSSSRSWEGRTAPCSATTSESGEGPAAPPSPRAAMRPRAKDRLRGFGGFFPNRPCSATSQDLEHFAPT
eukprot:4751082-Pyramimonas_sp.AAC.1